MTIYKTTREICFDGTVYRQRTFPAGTQVLQVASNVYFSTSIVVRVNHGSEHFTASVERRHLEFVHSGG